MKKYVLTGGPCSGKTTIINALAIEGYAVVPEAARIVIKELAKNNKNTETWRGSVHERQLKILELQLKLEKEIEERVKSEKREDTTIFFDHGIPSGIPFYKISGNPVPAELLDASRKEKRNYAKIFFLETVAYKTDSVRKEPPEIAKKIAELTYEAYKNLGYLIVALPAMPVQQRVKFIKENLQ